MKISYKYRIYPNQRQVQILEENLDFCCSLYNGALKERLSYYEKYGTSRSYAAQSVQLPEIKEFFKEETRHLYSQTIQQTLKRLDQTYQNFYRRVKQGEKKPGFPRKKSRSRYRSLVFPQCNLKTGGVKLLENQRVKIFGMPGEVRVEWHRPFQGRCKQVTLLKQGMGRYYIILSCDEVPLAHLPSTGKTVALDLGISTFIMTDDGTQFHHPKPYRTAKEKLAFLQKKLAAKQKGSKNRERAKSQLARAYEKVTNVRDDFLHKITKKLVAENDTIIIEKLNVKGMLESPGFEVRKENIQDASWGRFATLLSYKAERAGRKVIEVDPKNTSRMCSCCGAVKESLSLQERSYHCSACGSTMDRDINAAINIKRRGLGMSLEDGTKSSIPEAISFS